MSGRLDGHRSHIPARVAKNRGVIPSFNIRQETRGMEVGINYMSGEYLMFSNADCNTATTISSCDDCYVSSGDTYAPYQTWVTPWYDPEPIAFDMQKVQTIIKEKEVTKEVEKRTLWEVYVVDPRKGGKVLAAFTGKDAVIAQNENQAMLKVNVLKVADDNNLELEQVDVYCRAIGTFVRPRKETQRVKMVDKEED